MKDKAEHLAIILLTIEVFDKLPTGECSGVPVSEAELKQYDLKRYIKVAVKGFDKNDCLTKVKALVDYAKQC